MGLRAAAYTTFCSLWRQLTPHITVMKPMSDLCWVCQKNSRAIMRAANTPESEKSQVNTYASPTWPCTYSHMHVHTHLHMNIRHTLITFRNTTHIRKCTHPLPETYTHTRTCTLTHTQPLNSRGSTFVQRYSKMQRHTSCWQPRNAPTTRTWLTQPRQSWNRYSLSMESWRCHVLMHG